MELLGNGKRDYRDLGIFSELVELTAPRRAGRMAPGPELVAAAREAIGVLDLAPGDARVERSWTSADGELVGEEVSWSVGFGPRTRAYLLRPAGADPAEPLPGVVALHCHGGHKWQGKEKIANGPDGPDGYAAACQEELYGGRAWADELARRGHVVLAHDTFLWGSRRIPADQIPGAEGHAAERAYDSVANPYEHVVSKWCGLLGTSVAGVVAGEDLAAAAYLRSRPEVDGSRIGCAGLSGGGCRSAMLGAFDGGMAAVAISAMMSTYDELLDGFAVKHTWMFQPAALSPIAEWPALTACAVSAGAGLLVQYARGDALFPERGMAAADATLAAACGEDGYQGQWFEGPHRFDVAMQEAAFSWLRGRLAARQ
ncbi:hypothetical protein BIV57_21655 [Mangrovactinospora gilvigrisea]|uniref:Acetylesterase n=1 Tax=Mangrovactinospora gilvigrisea TaxID=1428644 RepID=A0A1J7C1F7_9ACTN|nr:hypothetical protein [Mangrovactinospora gilvigrisea]OIV35400.1 hypothetical protein BIV57_21655 [Mangrovactinospora gilvigrisea]